MTGRLLSLMLLGWAAVLASGQAALAQAPKPGAHEGGEHYAFLVACADYDKKELRPLNFARNDIVDMQQALLDAGMLQENIVLLHDQRPERRYLPEGRKIREEFRLLLSELQPDDTLLVAFAGHGVQFKGEKQAYFCPVDARMAERGTLIGLDEIYKELEKCKARRKVVLIDACRNDPISALSRSAEKVESATRPQSVDVPQGLLVLHSCSPGQLSFEDPTLKHGVFFHQVLQGYGGKADADKNGQITMDELSTFVTRETQKYTRLNLSASQIPQRKGEFSGEWTLRQIGKPIEHAHIEHCVPDDSEFIFAINVEQMLSSSKARANLPALAKAPRLAGQYEHLLRSTDLNPLEDVVNIVVASPPAVNGVFDRMTVTIHGRFNPGKLAAGWIRAGHKPMRVSDGGKGQFLLFQSNVPGQPRTFMAALDRATIVVALKPEMVVDVLLKEKNRKEPNIRNKHLELLLENRYDQKASVWMVMMGTGYSANGQSLRSQGIKYFVGTFVLGEDVDFRVVFSTDNPEVTSGLAVPAEWRRLISGMVQERQDIAAAIIRGCTLFPDKSYLHLRGKVDADVFMRWFDGR